MSKEFKAFRANTYLLRKIEHELEQINEGSKRKRIDFSKYMEALLIKDSREGFKTLKKRSEGFEL